MEQELNKVRSKYLKRSTGQCPCDCSTEGQGHKSDEMSESMCEKSSLEQKSVLITNAADSDVSGDGQKSMPDKNEQNSVLDTVSEKIGDMLVSEENAEGENVILEHVCDTTEARYEDEIQCNNRKENLTAGDFKILKTNVLNVVTETLTEHSTLISKASCDTMTEKGSKANANTENCDGKSVPVIPFDTAAQSKLPVHVNRTKFKQQDLLVPWKLKGKKKVEKQSSAENTFHRFYHVFKKGELESLCSKVPECMVKHSYYDQGNWAVILEKL